MGDVSNSLKPRDFAAMSRVKVFQEFTRKSVTLRLKELLHVVFDLSSNILADFFT